MSKKKERIRFDERFRRFWGSEGRNDVERGEREERERGERKIIARPFRSTARTIAPSYAPKTSAFFLTQI